MGKILAIIGIVFGVIGLLAAIGIFFTLAGLPTKMKDLAFTELDKVKATVVNVESTANATNGALDGIKDTVVSISSASTASATAMVEMGYATEKLANDLSLIGLDVSRLRSASTLMKSINVSNIAASSQAFSTKMDQMKSSINEVKVAFNRTKTSIVNIKATMEDFSSLASRLVLILSVFLAAVSLALVVFSVNMYTMSTNDKKK